MFGATGSQGGSVVSALDKTKYQVRAVTRNANSDKAQKLKELGAEVVQASMDETESLSSAVAGSHGVFIVTNFWEHMDKEREIRQGKSVVDACVAAKVQHVVYSGLENVQAITGKSCPHFDGKGKVEEHLKATGIPFTIARYSFYYENLLNGMALGGYQKADGNDHYTITTCMKGGMDGVSVEATGAAIATIFEKPETYAGKTIGLSGDRLSMQEYMDVISEVTGKKVVVHTMTIEEYEQLPFPGADDLAAMFHFYIHGNPDRNIQMTKELDKNTPSFKDWAFNNKSKFVF